MRIKTVINPEYGSLAQVIENTIAGLVAGKNETMSVHGHDKYLPAGAEYIYEGRNNLYRLKIGGANMIVKDFERPNILNRFVYTTLRKSKARRSYENSLRMEELGFRTPRPIAYCEVKRGLELVWSFYISEELTGAREMRDWEKNPDNETLVPAFASEMYRLHRAGIHHKDFTPGNILYFRQPDGSYLFYYVDLNRISFGVRDSDKLMRMFRAINTNPAETERLGRLYAKAANLDEEYMARRARKELEGYFEEQKLKKKFK